MGRFAHTLNESLLTLNDTLKFLVHNLRFFSYSLNGPRELQMQWSEVKDITPFRHGYAKIRTQVLAISGPSPNMMLI